MTAAEVVTLVETGAVLITPKKAGIDVLTPSMTAAGVGNLAKAGTMWFTPT